VAIHIVDRRLNPGSKSLENRQRFLRRAKALVQGAVKKTSQDRDIKDVLEGGEVAIPMDGMEEPRFRREGGTRDMVLPGNKKFVEGDYLPRPSQSGGKGSGAGEGDTIDLSELACSTITLTQGAIDLSVLGDHHINDLTIIGPGAAALTIDGNGDRRGDQKPHHVLDRYGEQRRVVILGDRQRRLEQGRTGHQHGAGGHSLAHTGDPHAAHRPRGRRT